jgi:4-hydroxy-4-methyl-2-oxoglutarate aldolase
VLFDDVAIHPGDLIVGDGDGVVAIPRQRAAEIVAASQAREAKEADAIRRIEAGERTLELYNF